MIELVMPRNLTVWGDEGIRGIKHPGPDRAFSLLRSFMDWKILACPVPMQSMSAIGGFDGRD